MLIRVAVLLFPTCLLAQSTSVLNMSHDLVTKGIASSNLQPNSPTQDARPLFEQAVAYATANNIATVTADPGNYYFLSLHSATGTMHALLPAAANLTIDWQNSDLYFSYSNHAAITCNACASLTMQNFTVDYVQLPFTQATITAVDSVNRNLTFQTIPGYQSPADFNANRATDGSDVIWVIFFRNGVPLNTVGRIAANRTVTGNIVNITDTNVWGNSAAIATIQPGDIMVYTDRSGPPALNFVNGQNITVHNVSVYASGQIGIYFGRTQTATADHDQVIPRPGTTRLISTNADGIHTSFANSAQTFSNNIVERTCDDALAIASEWLATVAQTPGTAAPTTVSVTRSIVGVSFAVGESVSFINPADATIAGSATIVSESPAVAQQTLAAGEAVTVTLSQAVAGLATGYEMIASDPTAHGSGSVIRNNTVHQGTYARGVWLSGVNNVSVHDNLVQQTSKVGIFVQQLVAPPGNTNNLDTGPSSGVTIQNNIVDSAMSYSALATGPILDAASIQVLSTSTQGGQVTTGPNTNIAITGNLVTNAPRTGIRMENVTGGQVTGNSIQGYGLAATTQVYYAPSCCETVAQYEADFKQAVVVDSSSNVTNATNVSSAATSALISSASAASYFPKVAPDSLVTAFWSNPSIGTTVAPATWPSTLGGVSVSITDSAGVTRLAPIYYVAATQLSFEVPDGTAPGIARVAIPGFTGGLQIDTLAPSLYSANSSGQGVAAATAALYSADGTVTPQTLFQCPTGGTCAASPMNLGNSTDQLYVLLYGTGLRNFSSLQNVKVTIGGVPAAVAYLGVQSQYPALDQMNVIVPHSLAGAGEVPIVLTVDGETANVVTISLK
jgi:uncharacterized protein (TIGR03437 family)